MARLPVYVTIVEVINGAFAVDVRTVSGTWFRHQGPKNFAYFTQQEAERLVRRIEYLGRIDPQYWIDGSAGHYGSADHEYALIEAEYYERHL